MKCVIHIDGGARGNPGPAGAGVVVEDGDGNILHEGGYFLGKATNNHAEYRGLIRALEVAGEHSATAVVVHSDSELLVRQVNGQYRVKADHLKPLFKQAFDLLKQFRQWRVEHIRREQNARADQLANMAMDLKEDVIVTG